MIVKFDQTEEYNVAYFVCVPCTSLYDILGTGQGS